MRWFIPLIVVIIVFCTGCNTYRSYSIANFNCTRLYGSEEVVCTSKQAIARKNSSLCSVLENRDYRERCIFEYAGAQDFEVCTSLDHSVDLEKCLSYAAIKRGSTEPCYFIKQQLGLEDCIIKVAIENFKPELCDEIVDNGRKSMCENTLSLKNIGQNKNNST